jgi:hypothetical protein
MNAEEIYQKHLAAFKEGNLPMGQASKYRTRDEIINALKDGELFPAIWKECAFHFLGAFDMIGLYSLLSFSTPAKEAKHKKIFIALLNNLNIQ